MHDSPSSGIQKRPLANAPCHSVVDAIAMATLCLVFIGRNRTDPLRHRRRLLRNEHGHGESPPGASFKPGKGVILTEETRKILDVQTSDVTEENQSAIFQIALILASRNFPTTS